jgi:hypothetical protein
LDCNAQEMLLVVRFSEDMIDRIGAL